MKLGHVLADRLDAPRHIDARNGPLRLPEPRRHANEVRLPSHEVPVEGIHRGRMNPNEHPVVVDSGHVDLSQSQNIR